VQAVFSGEKQDRIHYELNLRESRLRDQLIVDFMAGPLKPLEIDEAGIEALSSKGTGRSCGCSSATSPRIATARTSSAV
jgi:hypothetical protein